MSIPVIGLSTTDFVPGTYIAVNFAAGASGGSASDVKLLLMGNCLASSFVNTNSLFDGYVFGPDVDGFTCASEQDVIDLFGSGSELHRMYSKVVSVNKTTAVYLIAVKESVGAAATGSITFATTAAGNGFVRTYVGDAFIDTAIATGDLPDTIATNVAAQINSNPKWAVTASPASATVTLTAKQKGPRGNAIPFAAKVQGTSVATTSTAQNWAYLSGGTTEDSFTAALATINPERYSYIATGAENAAGNLLALVNQVVTNAQPVPGIRQRVLSAFTGTLGSATTFANALNTPVADCIWQQKSKLTPAELASYAAGVYCLAESQSVPDLNFDGLGTVPANAALWQVPGSFDGTTATHATVKSALINGLSPVTNTIGGKSQLVSAVTTYSKNPATSALDTRVRDHGIVTVMFLGADKIQSMVSQSFNNKLAAQDPAQGQRQPGPQVMTPSVLKAAINRVIFNMEQDDLLQNADISQAATQVQLESDPAGRFGCRVQLQPISIAHQFAINIDQVTFLQ